MSDVERLTADAIAFADLMKQEPCELYAHALREAANALFYVMTEAKDGSRR